MKRFYCTICKRERRVRKFPTNVQNISSEQVAERKGTCNWHDAPAVTRKPAAILSHAHVISKVGR